jgi:hypothetical protein
LDQTDEGIEELHPLRCACGNEHIVTGVYECDGGREKRVQLELRRTAWVKPGGRGLREVGTRR